MSVPGFGDRRTYEDCLFERAVELDCKPELVYTGGGSWARWICNCVGHRHASDAQKSFFITWESLQRVERLGKGL